MNFLITHRFHNFFCIRSCTDEVPLEVKMRFEQVITAVTRPVVVATVREIKVVVSFVRDMTLHLCQQWKPFGMPAYSRSLFMLPKGNMGMHCLEVVGGQRGSLCLQPNAADTSCPMGTRNA